MANVKIEIEHDQLILTGTDLEIQIIAKISIENAVSGSITVPARKFLDICRLLPVGSEINFEYYLNGIKKSFPDFLLMDKYGKIHIFESKSLNSSNNLNIDGQAYDDKINALKTAYLEISKFVPYNFYIPIKEGDQWKVFNYFEGKEKVISKETIQEILSSR